MRTALACRMARAGRTHRRTGRSDRGTPLADRRGVVVDPVRRRPHDARPGKVRLLAEVAARVVVAQAAGGVDDRLPDEARIRPRLPRVGLVSALVLPAVEVGVIVLAAGLEQVRVVRDEHRLHACAPQVHRQRLLPELDAAPRPPQEVERAARGCRGAPACTAASPSSAGRSATPARRSGRGSASRTRGCRTRRACAGSGCRAG